MYLSATYFVGDYKIHEHADFGSDRQTVYSFDLGDGSTPGEYYPSLDMALIAMIGEKYTGPRGANGPNVGTAADWFAKMIGLTA